MSMNEELDRLVDTYNIDTRSEQYKRTEFVEKLSRHLDLENASALELGAASGRLTKLIASRCRRVVAVDGSARFLELARAEVGTLPVSFVHSLFENYTSSEVFDLVLMHHILEHVHSPRELLVRVRSFLAPGGLLAISVPNAHALSRQLAVKMGLLQSLYELTENDRRHGHQRVYDWPGMEEDVVRAGYKVVARHGLSLKLFADFQNEQIISAGTIGDTQMSGLWKLAEDHRDVSGAIMLVVAAE